MTSIRFSPEDFPDSRYARELQSGFRSLRFRLDIEREYWEAHVQRVCLRVRLFFLLGTLCSAAYLGRSLADPHVVPAEPWLHALVLTLYLVVLMFTFTHWFHRYYLRVASVVVPLVSVLCTVLAVMQIVRGRLDLLMLISMFPILLFFLAGLGFRAAAMSALLSAAAFLVTTMHFELAPELLYPCAGTLLVAIAICALVAWDKEHAHRESFLESRMLAELAAVDGLTGVKNRRSFDEHLPRVWQQAAREQCGVAVMLIDCDHFKRYNDGCGHQAGDDALRTIARIVDSFARRPLDIAARYGGEEFALVLYDAPESVVNGLAEELRVAVERARIEHDRSFAVPVMTVSVGVALFYPASSGHASDAAVQLVDKALYTAKRLGRNRVSIVRPAITRSTNTLVRIA